MAQQPEGPIAMDQVITVMKVELVVAVPKMAQLMELMMKSQNHTMVPLMAVKLTVIQRKKKYDI